MTDDELELGAIRHARALWIVPLSSGRLGVLGSDYVVLGIARDLQEAAQMTEEWRKADLARIALARGSKAARGPKITGEELDDLLKNINLEMGE